MEFSGHYVLHKSFKIDEHSHISYFAGEHKVDIPFLPITIVANISHKIDNSRCTYSIKINHTPTIITILVVWLTGMFFSNFSVTQFLFFAGISSVFLYSVINAFAVRAVVKFLKIPESNGGKDYTIIDNQQSWINDPTKCPGCGSEIVRGQRTCKSCGLSL